MIFQMQTEIPVILRTMQRKNTGYVPQQDYAEQPQEYTDDYAYDDYHTADYGKQDYGKQSYQKRGCRKHGSRERC